MNIESGRKPKESRIDFHKNVNGVELSIYRLNPHNIKMKQIQINKSEKELLFEKIIDFVKENSFIKRVSYGDNNKARFMKCPCCNDYWTHQILENERYWNYKDNDEIKEMLWKHYQLHLLARIRLRGDIDHIRLFVKIFGKDFAKIKLREYAKKSMIVYNNLKLVLKEMGV